MNPAPRISIITPCLNRARWVDEAVRSVLAQRGPDVEHIIIDGGSTDGTLAVLASHPHLRVHSGPDEGMYDALNRGLAKARGEIIGFLNTDDLYAEGAFDAALAEFTAGDAFAVGGESAFDDWSGDVRVEGARFRPSDGPLLEHATIGAPSFNAWFFRREVFERVGTFDARMRVAGDRDFMLRFVLAGLPYRTIDFLTYRYLRHAGSISFAPGGNAAARAAREHVRMCDKAFARADLTDDARMLLRRMRTRETLDLAARDLRRADLQSFLRDASAATLRDPLWPARLAQRAFAAAWRRVAR